MRHTWRIISYFTIWGIAYGFIIGLLTGATAWIVGAVVGITYGTIVGAGIGLSIGVITAIIHRHTFHEDIDITLYRRRLAAFYGLLVFIGGLYVLVALIMTFLRRPPYGTTLADFYPLIVVFVSKTTILTALCVAYITSHYPDWFIRTFYSPRPQPNPAPIRESFNLLWKHVFKPAYLALGVGLTMCLYTLEILRSSQIETSTNLAGVMLISFVWSVVMYPVLTLYLSLGNAVVLTFIKRLIFDEGLIVLSAYHYKSVMAVISFLFTVMMTAWGWVLSPFYDVRFFDPVNNAQSLIMIAPPIIGLLTAFHVSNTLALPDDDKTKRKEMTHDHTTA